MATEIYGASDDLIEIRGNVNGEHCHDDGFLIVSDGTVLKIKYGKDAMAIWEIRLIEKGNLFATIDPCFDENEARYSDTAMFDEGVKWVYFAKELSGRIK